MYKFHRQEFNRVWCNLLTILALIFPMCIIRNLFKYKMVDGVNYYYRFNNLYWNLLVPFNGLSFILIIIKSSKDPL